MAQSFVHVRLQIRGLTAMQRAFAGGMPPGQSAAIDDMFRKWGARYSADMRRRYDLFSRGGGNWAPLAPSTIAARRYKGGRTIGGARRATLQRLRAVGVSSGKGARVQQLDRQLRRARLRKDVATATKLTRKLKDIAGAAGRVSILRDRGILFGALTIGTSGNRFDRVRNGVRYGFRDVPHAGSRMTIAAIADRHQRGGPNLPRRAILVQPDQQTRAGMIQDLGVAVRRIAREAGGGAAA